VPKCLVCLTCERSNGHRLLMLERLIQMLRDKGAVFSRMDAAVESDQRCPSSG
jgi:hypothetical protein